MSPPAAYHSGNDEGQMDFPRYAAIAIAVYFVCGALLKKLDDLHTEDDLPDDLRDQRQSPERRAALRVVLSSVLLAIAAVGAWVAMYLLWIVLGLGTES